MPIVSFGFATTIPPWLPMCSFEEHRDGTINPGRANQPGIKPLWQLGDVQDDSFEMKGPGTAWGTLPGAALGVLRGTERGTNALEKVVGRLIGSTRISGSVGPAARRYSPQSFAPHRARGCAYADVSRARP
jgi:hypothetical protein